MRRLVLGIVASVMLLGLLAGGAWAYTAKAWLWDDFRNGYEAGVNLTVPNINRDGHKACLTEAEKAYGKAAPHTDEEASFQVGCARGLAGVSNDFWRVEGYLAD